MAVPRTFGAPGSRLVGFRSEPPFRSLHPTRRDPLPLNVLQLMNAEAVGVASSHPDRAPLRFAHDSRETVT